MNAVLEKRNELRLTQTEFAWLIGVHPITISKWENGKPVPPYYRTLITKLKIPENNSVAVRYIMGTHGPVYTLAYLLKHLVKS